MDKENIANSTFANRSGFDGSLDSFSVHLDVARNSGGPGR